MELPTKWTFLFFWLFIFSTLHIIYMVVLEENNIVSFIIFIILSLVNGIGFEHFFNINPEVALKQMKLKIKRWKKTIQEQKRSIRETEITNEDNTIIKFICNWSKSRNEIAEELANEMEKQNKKVRMILDACKEKNFSVKMIRPLNELYWPSLLYFTLLRNFLTTFPFVGICKTISSIVTLKKKVGDFVRGFYERVELELIRYENIFLKKIGIISNEDNMKFKISKLKDCGIENPKRLVNNLEKIINSHVDKKILLADLIAMIHIFCLTTLSIFDLTILNCIPICLAGIAIAAVFYQALKKHITEVRRILYNVLTVIIKYDELIKNDNNIRNTRIKVKDLYECDEKKIKGLVKYMKLFSVQHSRREEFLKYIRLSKSTNKKKVRSKKQVLPKNSAMQTQEINNLQHKKTSKRDNGKSELLTKQEFSEIQETHETPEAQEIREKKSLPIEGNDTQEKRIEIVQEAVNETELHGHPTSHDDENEIQEEEKDYFGDGNAIDEEDIKYYLVSNDDHEDHEEEKELEKDHQDNVCANLKFIVDGLKGSIDTLEVLERDFIDYLEVLEKPIWGSISGLEKIINEVVEEVEKEESEDEEEVEEVNEKEVEKEIEIKGEEVEEDDEEEEEEEVKEEEECNNDDYEDEEYIGHVFCGNYELIIDSVDGSTTIEYSEEDEFDMMRVNHQGTLICAFGASNDLDKIYQIIEEEEEEEEIEREKEKERVKEKEKEKKRVEKEDRDEDEEEKDEEGINNYNSDEHKGYFCPFGNYELIIESVDGSTTIKYSEEDEFDFMDVDLEGKLLRAWGASYDLDKVFLIIEEEKERKKQKKRVQEEEKKKERVKEEYTDEVKEDKDEEEKDEERINDDNSDENHSHRNHENLNISYDDTSDSSSDSRKSFEVIDEIIINEVVEEVEEEVVEEVDEEESEDEEEVVEDNDKEEEEEIKKEEKECNNDDYYHKEHVGYVFCQLTSVDGSTTIDFPHEGMFDYLKVNEEGMLVWAWGTSPNLEKVHQNIEEEKEKEEEEESEEEEKGEEESEENEEDEKINNDSNKDKNTQNLNISYDKTSDSSSDSNKSFEFVDMLNTDNSSSGEEYDALVEEESISFEDDKKFKNKIVNPLSLKRSDPSSSGDEDWLLL